MNAEVGMNSLWVIGVKDQFAAKLEARMDPVSFLFVVSTDKGYFGFPVGRFIFKASHLMRCATVQWRRQIVSSVPYYHR